MAASNVPPAAATRPRPSATAALLGVTGGSAAAVLVLCALAAVAGPLGVELPAGLAAALDPARSDSLAELWGNGWLAAAATLALATGCRRNDPALLRLAALPAALLLVEVGDLPARLEHLAAASLGVPPGSPTSKFLAGGLAGGFVLAAAALAVGGPKPDAARLARRLLAVVLVAGGASLACDVTAARCAFVTPDATAMAHGLVAVEEAIELVLYVLVAAGVLGAAAQRLPRAESPESGLA